jgi:hypothetical protein
MIDEEEAAVAYLLDPDQEALLHARGSNRLTPLRAVSSGLPATNPLDEPLSQLLCTPSARISVLTADLWSCGQLEVLQDDTGSGALVSRDEQALRVMPLSDPMDLVDHVSAVFDASSVVDPVMAVVDRFSPEHFLLVAAAVDVAVRDQVRTSSLPAMPHDWLDVRLEDVVKAANSSDPRTLVGWSRSAGLTTGVGVEVMTASTAAIEPTRRLRVEGGYVGGDIITMLARDLGVASPRVSVLREDNVSPPSALHAVRGQRAIWFMGPGENGTIEIRQGGSSLFRRAAELVMVPEPLIPKWFELASDVGVAAPDTTSVLDAGTPVRIIDEDDGWLGLEVADGRRFWVDAEAVDDCVQ